jgi:hypothetical protein
VLCENIGQDEKDIDYGLSCFPEYDKDNATIGALYCHDRRIPNRFELFIHHSSE